MNFKPSEKRLLIKPDEVTRTTESGIIIPDSVKEERPVTGVVVVGSETYPTDAHILFSKYGFDEVVIENVTYNVVHEDSVLGTF